FLSSKSSCDPYESPPLAVAGETSRDRPPAPAPAGLSLLAELLFHPLLQPEPLRVLPGLLRELLPGDQQVGAVDPVNPVAAEHPHLKGVLDRVDGSNLGLHPRVLAPGDRHDVPLHLSSSPSAGARSEARRVGT